MNCPTVSAKMLARRKFPERGVYAASTFRASSATEDKQEAALNVMINSHGKEEREEF